MVTEVDTEEAVEEAMVVQLLQSHTVHATHNPKSFRHFMQYLGTGANSTFHMHSNWTQKMGNHTALLRTESVRKGGSKHAVQQDCESCDHEFNLATGCGAIYDEMTGRIDLPTAMSIYQGSFPDPDCVYCENFNPDSVCDPEWEARRCKDCGDFFDKGRGCGAMFSLFAGELSEKEAMSELFASFPCGDEMKQCEFNLEGVCTEWQANQSSGDTRAQQLEAAKQCTERENCETCLYSEQCKGYGGNPSPIYCCPKMKRCLDVTPEGIEAGRQGCAGDRVCPGRCSESPYRSPDYPFDCGDECPGWDPLGWVSC